MRALNSFGNRTTGHACDGVDACDPILEVPIKILHSMPRRFLIVMIGAVVTHIPPLRAAQDVEIAAIWTFKNDIYNLTAANFLA
jgi:hypothetical protein